MLGWKLPIQALDNEPVINSRFSCFGKARPSWSQDFGGHPSTNHNISQMQLLHFPGNAHIFLCGGHIWKANPKAQRKGTLLLWVLCISISVLTSGVVRGQSEKLSFSPGSPLSREEWDCAVTNSCQVKCFVIFFICLWVFKLLLREEMDSVKQEAWRRVNSRCEKRSCFSCFESFQQRIWCNISQLLQAERLYKPDHPAL